MEQWRAILLHGPAVLNELADAVLLCDLWELGCENAAPLLTASVQSQKSCFAKEVPPTQAPMG